MSRKAITRVQAAIIIVVIVAAVAAGAYLSIPKPAPPEIGLVPQAFQPFQDVRIRKAFTLAFNRTAYIHDVQQDFAVPATQIVPPGMFGYDPSIPETPYDPATAKQLLLEAGATPITPANAFSKDKPQTIEITYNIGNTARETAATILANTINSFGTETGLFCKVVGLAWPQFLQFVRTKQTNVFFLGWIVDYVDPDDFLVPFAHGTAGTFAIRMGYNNPDVTKLIEDQARTKDVAAREQMIKQIETKVNDDYTFLFMNYGTAFSLSRSWLQERVGASVASGLESYNQAIYGFYFSEMTKDPKAPNPDSIIEETIGQPDTLDPATDYETAGGAVIQNVYETLLFFKGDKADQVVPWLASSYDVSPDGLTYTFHIRPGITFTDGTPLDANAVYFSLMRALIMDDPDGPAWAMAQVIRGGANYSKQYNNAGPSAPNGYGDKYTKDELDDLINAKPVEVIDPMTVAVHLERPYAGWSFVMAFSIAAIVSPTAIKAHWTAPTDGTPYIDGVTAGDYHNELNAWPAENMVGTGPYMLKSWDKASQTVILETNPNYWGGPESRGVAPVKNVIIKGIDDPNTRVLDLKAGTSDIGGIPVTGGLIFQFVDKDTWFSQHKLVSLSPDYVVFPKQGLWPVFATYFIGFNEKIYTYGPLPAQAISPSALLSELLQLPVLNSLLSKIDMGL